MTANKQVIVIGAGISGLTTAYRLKTLGVDVMAVESSDSPGGVIRSDLIDDYLIERGPNTVQGTPDFLNLVEELGISGFMIEGDPKAPAYIYFKGSLHRVPRGPRALLGTDLLTLSAKLGLLAEPFRARRRSETEESVASFFGRRLGSQVAERFAGPFMSGIYAGDPNRLSIQAAFPVLSRLEQEHGSLLMGAIGQMRKARKTKKDIDAKKDNADPGRSSPATSRPRRGRRSCSFRMGMQYLPERLARCLGGDLAFDTKVLEISECSAPLGREDDARFALRLATREGEKHITCSKLVIATPAFVASRLLVPLSGELSQLLREIEYPPLVIVSLGYDVAQIKTSLNGFGFLAAPGEGLNVLGCVFNSSLFEGRAPDGKVLLTCFVGGASNPIIVRRKDMEISDLVHSDLKNVLGIDGEPEMVALTRYEHSIPQYNIGHAERARKIDSLVKGIAGLDLVGNYLHGVSTGDCIKDGERTARKVAGEIFS
jgi:protoporphyrinogen/coproporphyrinogen III oxidase